MKMKKLFNVALLTLVSIAASADPVDKSTALYTAKNYLAQKGKVMVESKMAYRAPRKTQALEQSYYYVFNAGNEQGYVIVSGDDRTPEILGYVDKGAFDINEIPENMKSWLQHYADQIKAMDDNNVKVDRTRLLARRKITATRRSVPELLTTRWNQGHPYNLTCPKYYKKDGTMDYPATGCTATAMAQVIAFYKYPEKTKAIIPAITNSYTLDDGTKKTVTTKAIPRNSIIDWENMRDTYDCNSSHQHNAQDTAVANLMYYCGQAVHMGYGASSGANFDAKSYVNYFGFDDSAFVGERGKYTIDEWFNMLYNEIAQGYPVLFSGFSSGGGHAFVLDGFDGDNLFHLNWGWGGGSNGWFLCDVLNPGDNSGIGASSSSDGYSMSQRALFNLRLPDNIRAESTTHMTIHEITIDGTSIKANYLNWTGATNSFNMGIVKKNDDGTFSLIGSSQSATSMSANTYKSVSFNLLKKLPEGSYIVSPASKLSTNRTWHPEYNCKSEYIRADVDANGVPKLTYVKPNYALSIDTIVFPGNCKAGSQQEVKVTFRNNGDEYAKEIKFYASMTNDMVYTENRSMVAIRKGETKTISFFFKPTEVGTYNLWFSTNDDKANVIGTGTVDIVDDAHAVKANLAVSGFSITNSVNNIVYGDRMIGRVSIKNNGNTPFNGKVKLQMWRQPNGSGTAWSASSRTVELSIEPAKTSIANFEFTGLSAGNKYYIQVAYVGQSGDLTSGGIWDHGWSLNSGFLSWKNDGTIAGAASKTTFMTSSTMCAVYVKDFKVTRISPNKNPNTLYVVAADTNVPQINSGNLVVAGHADRIDLVDGNPYYIPTSFIADTATFTHVFPETADGTSWETFTMPFKVDSIAVDSIASELNDSLNHFWIYEYAFDGDNHEVIFKPAEVLRANTAYIIAADSRLAGKSITFFGRDVNFYKSGSDKMLVSSNSYKFYGTTYNTTVKNAYVLNSTGTAFEYVDVNTKLNPMSTYFISELPDSLCPDSIALPEIPVSADTIPETLPGDISGDGVVDGMDLVELVNAIINSKEGEEISPVYDINGDGVLDGVDIVVLVNLINGKEDEEEGENQNPPSE